jgi:kindlin 2
LDCRVDFSVKTFNAVVTLCKELGIRHPEELSFAKPLESDDLRYNYRERESNTSHKKRSVANNSADTNTFIGHHGNSTHSSNNSLDNIKATSGCTPVLPNTTINRSPAPVPTPISSPVNVSLYSIYSDAFVLLCVCLTLHRDDDNNNNNTTNTNHHYFLIHQSGTWRKNSPFSTPGSNGHNATPSIFDMTANNSLNTTGNSSFSNMDMSLALSPATPSQEARSKLLRPKNLIERARLNVA